MTDRNLSNVLDEAHAANVLNARKKAKSDGSYASEWNRYKRWVDSQDDLVSPPYLTRMNVDLYYSQVVAKRPGAAGAKSAGIDSCASSNAHQS